MTHYCLHLDYPSTVRAGDLFPAPTPCRNPTMVIEEYGQWNYCYLHSQVDRDFIIGWLFYLLVQNRKLREEP